MLRQPAVTGRLADGPSGWRGHKSGPPGWWGHKSGPLGWWAREGSTGSVGQRGVVRRGCRSPVATGSLRPCHSHASEPHRRGSWRRPLRSCGSFPPASWFTSERTGTSTSGSTGRRAMRSSTTDNRSRIYSPRTTCRSRTPHLPSLLSVRSRSVGVIEALWWLASSAALVFTLYRVMICTGGTPQNPGAAPATLSAPATAAPGPGGEAPARHAVIPNGRGERTSTQDSWSFSPSAIAYRSLIVTITLRNPGARVGLDSEHRIDLDL